jgi:hypothetical protein
VASIGRRDIEAIHVAMKDRPYPANRVLSLLSKMFNLAIEWKWQSDYPVEGIERYQEQKRDRWLSDHELRRLWAALEDPSEQAGHECHSSPAIDRRTAGRGSRFAQRRLRSSARRMDEAFASNQAEAHGASAPRYVVSIWPGP